MRDRFARIVLWLDRGVTKSGGCKHGTKVGTSLCVGFSHYRRVVCACSAGAVGSFSNKPLSPNPSLNLNLKKNNLNLKKSLFKPKRGREPFKRL